MFTGIVKELGAIKILDRRNSLLRLAIAAPFVKEVKTGDSISVNGVCLTVIGSGDTLHPCLGTGSNQTTIFRGTRPRQVMYFDVMLQTVKTTTLSKLRVNDKVNLEPALKAGDRLGGHIVTGHVDIVGIIKRKDVNSAQAIFEIGLDNKFMSGIVDKGSIAVDGISLTVAGKKRDFFIVSVIPHTLKVTTLGLKKAGDSVNIELDVMGKYSRQGPEQASIPAKSKITKEFLQEHGF